MTRHFTKTKFSNDAIDNMDFPGYTDGTTWNGWACPYFDYHQAQAVLKASEKYGYRWSYDKYTDSFVVMHVDDPEYYSPEQFTSVDISIDQGRTISVYPIGAYAWAWRRAADQ